MSSTELVPREPESSRSEEPRRHRGVEIAEERLARATSPEEAILATRIRGEILRQDRELENDVERRRQAAARARHRRFKEYSAIALQFTAFFGGGVLVFVNHEWIGGFAMAAALYGIAKDFVMQKFPGGKDRKDDDGD